MIKRSTTIKRVFPLISPNKYLELKLNYHSVTNTKFIGQIWPDLQLIMSAR